MLSLWHTSARQAWLPVLRVLAHTLRMACALQPSASKLRSQWAVGATYDTGAPRRDVHKRLQQTASGLGTLRPLRPCFTNRSPLRRDQRQKGLLSQRAYGAMCVKLCGKCLCALRNKHCLRDNPHMSKHGSGAPPLERLSGFFLLPSSVDSFNGAPAVGARLRPLLPSIVASFHP